MPSFDATVGGFATLDSRPPAGVVLRRRRCRELEGLLASVPVENRLPRTYLCESRTVEDDITDDKDLLPAARDVFDDGVAAAVDLRVPSSEARPRLATQASQG